MSAFDWLVLVVTFASVVTACTEFIPPRRRRVVVLWAASLAVIHGATAQRVSFVPVLAVAVAMAALVLTGGPRRRWSRAVAVTLGVAGVLLGGAMAWAFPLFHHPDPTGPHRVGSRWLVLADSSRGEDFSPDPLDRRTLLVRLWYPTTADRGDLAPFLTREEGDAIATALGLPSFAFRHLVRVKTHSITDAPIEERAAPWPLVIFSHGYDVGYESQNSVQMEALASHGYVVASIAHPYEAGAVVFPDGHVVRTHASRDTAGARLLAPVAAKFGTETDTAALREVVATMQRRMKLDASMTRWTADTRFVLDRLATLTAPGAAGGLWPGRVDATRVGIFGMSFGGATAANFCTVDPRCVAGINLDGMTFGEATTVPMPRPFLFATSAPNGHLHDLFYERARAPAVRMRVAGSHHLDYTDFGFVSPLFATMGILGGIPAREMHAIMNEVVLGFLDEHLRGGPPLDLDALRRHAAVTVDRRVPVAPAPPPGA